ncbi:MAG: F0F1 ATP synthase subunit epsilon [Clostridiales bacterium]|nr:F0F1 ATP synthase subunit epsilon [Clostridiales bacterium]
MKNSDPVFELTVTTPGGNVFTGEASAIYVRGAEGDLAVLAGHIPFATAVKAGNCRIERPDGSILESVIGGGLLSVGSDRVTLMTGSFSGK